VHGSSTVIPGHYHASIGAVTVAYMALSYRMLERLRLPLSGRRTAWLRAWQPPLFGAGQLVFAVGFALAGAHGMARKTYGAEQHLRTAGETLGLCIMGLGGAVAVAAGVTFLFIAMRAWLQGQWSAASNDGGMKWNRASIRSRS
jgi:heme/copper-type cytochrome/quinol oxidase subunit 1